MHPDHRRDKSPGHGKPRFSLGALLVFVAITSALCVLVPPLYELLKLTKVDRRVIESGVAFVALLAAAVLVRVVMMGGGKRD